MERSSYIDLENQKILISNFLGTEQEQDLSEPPNCNGFGRIRHFRRSQSNNWVDDPLPIDPATHFFGLSERLAEIRTQVFQMAYCNMACWYCFVPNNLKNATRGKWISVSELLDLLLREDNTPKVIDLSGGNPELTPEWTYWFMKELTNRNLNKKFYLWSDDTLSTESMFEYMKEDEIQFMANYEGYGKVCCFKGFDPYSYSFNSSISNKFYDSQFIRFKKYFDMGFDTYGYITLTTDNLYNVKSNIVKFMDKLQAIRDWLPLKIVPLKIVKFTPTCSRIGIKQEDAIKNQFVVLEVWKEEIEKRFSAMDRAKNIVDVR
ncbi:MAG: 4Fe-4S cluster-binding domain-containing protein [Clostridia bacterium]|nr:4Fe-4S cluster-binding domain-containing protein [Clostridia bacterium]